jgi:hypothetical protein
MVKELKANDIPGVEKFPECTEVEIKVIINIIVSKQIREKEGFDFQINAFFRVKDIVPVVKPEYRSKAQNIPSLVTVHRLV